MKKSLKKALTVSVTVIMVVAAMLLLSVCSTAHAATYSGACGESGDNVQWSLDTKTSELSITGKGKMSDEAPWRSYSLDYIKSVKVANGVTNIPAGSFYNCTNLTSISIPKSVTSIEKSAFNGCSSLESITIPESVKTIGAYAFENCTSLKSIEIPNGITSIANYLFFGCSNLTSVSIPESVTSIGGNAFFDCTSLKNISVPDSVTSIGYYAFANSAWYNSQPKGVVYAGKVAYSYKGKMPENTSIALKSDTVSIACYAFAGFKNLVNITIPNSVKSIDSKSFADCTGLKSISIPNSVLSIGAAAFSGCSGLKNVIIPNSIKTIETCTFYNCTGLTGVTIQTSVKTIEEGAFENCSKLKNIYYPGTQKQWSAVSIDSHNSELSNDSVFCITLSSTSFICNGKERKPTVTVQNGSGKTLKASSDYTVTYKNNKEIGKASVTVTFKGSHSGSKTLSFKIIPAKVSGLKASQTASSITLTWTKVTGATSYNVYSYNAKTKKYTKLTAAKTNKAAIKNLKAGTAYSYAVEAYANSQIGAKSAVLSTATKPAAPTLKATAGTKQAKLSWNKVTGATGYEIYYSESKNGEFKKLASASSVSYTAKKLTTGNTYYFKVRAYKTVDKTNIYSGYSEIKKVIIK